MMLFWGTAAQAQVTFETQFSKEAEKMIGETEKHVSGEQVAELLMRSAQVRAEGAKNVVEGHLLIVFFGEEGAMLHTVASDPVKLDVEPPFIDMMDVMPGDRVVEGFEQTLGEYGFRMGDIKAWEPPPVLWFGKSEGEEEPPPVLWIGKKEGEKEPPPIMTESGELNPDIAKGLWGEVREPGVSVAFVPTLGRYIEGDVEEMQVRPAMITGALGK